MQIPRPVEEGGRNADVVVSVNYGRGIFSDKIEEQHSDSEGSSIIEDAFRQHLADVETSDEEIDTEPTSWLESPGSSPEAKNVLIRTKTFGEKGSGRSVSGCWEPDDGVVGIRVSQVGVAC